jgi:sarcosine oxidase subunit alpha
VLWDPRAKTFVVEADAQGRTANDSLFVAGEMTGSRSAADAAASGRAAAEAVAGGTR